MALSATIRRFEINLSDSDRELYTTFDWRVAQHPSESERYLAARLIARVLEHDEGVEFGKGLSNEDEPAIWQKNLRGELQAWIEVGAPSPERIHRASKAAAKVVIYCWKQPDKLAEDYAEAKVHRREHIKIVRLSPEFLDGVASLFDRNNSWELSVTGGTIYLGAGDKTIEGDYSVVTNP